MEETLQLGRQLGQQLKTGQVICLAGTLGAGKTHLTRGLALGWGSDDHPTSPTFGLVNIYQRPSDTNRFYHIDCYRLENSNDVWSLGFADILDDPTGVVVIEWPERIKTVLPTERLWITITQLSDTSRAFEFNPTGEAAVQLTSSLERFR